VHHADFPVTDKNAIDESLEERMQLAQDVSSLILSLRKKVNIKVRQPLQKILIPIFSEGMKAQLQKVAELIKAEVNIKQIELISNTEGIIQKKIKPNFKVLGSKLGAHMKEAAAALSALSQHQIAALEKNEQIILKLSNAEIPLSLHEVEIIAEDIPGWTVASKGILTVALDITLNEALKQEGDAREFINRIQNMRKDSGF